MSTRLRLRHWTTYIPETSLATTLWNLKGSLLGLVHRRPGASILTTMDLPSSPETTSPTVGKSSSVSIDAAINNKAPPTTTHRTVMHDDPDPIRRRPTSGAYNFDALDETHRIRRSSTFSRYSWSEVSRDLHDDIIDPGPMLHDDETSWRSSLPLMFAILPATVGLVFKNGSSFITDVILLGLTAVFLHWSVTAPWKWYHSAQQIREENEAVVETAFEEDDDDEDSESNIIDTTPSSSASPSKRPPQDADSQLKLGRASLARSALKKLRIHEVLALTACFVAPAVATYMLHFIRDLLSRPSEGLVSNFNLTIFLLAAEISPLSHSIKLIQSKTFHLQRIVHSHQNPHNQKKDKVTMAQWKELLARLDELELRQQHLQPQNGHTSVGSMPNEQKALHAALVREVRNAVQPEIDALNRAVRRYEKKARVLALQTESRLRELGTRVDDAISLSAMAVSSRRKSIGGMGVAAVAQQWGGWCLGGVISVLLLPVRAVVGGMVKVVEGVGWVFGFGSGRGELRRRQKWKGLDRRWNGNGNGNGNVSSGSGGGRYARR